MNTRSSLLVLLQLKYLSRHACTFVHPTSIEDVLSPPPFGMFYLLHWGCSMSSICGAPPFGMPHLLHLGFSMFSSIWDVLSPPSFGHILCINFVGFYNKNGFIGAPPMNPFPGSTPRWTWKPPKCALGGHYQITTVVLCCIVLYCMCSQFDIIILCTAVLFPNLGDGNKGIFALYS